MIHKSNPDTFSVPLYSYNALMYSLRCNSKLSGNHLFGNTAEILGLVPDLVDSGKNASLIFWPDTLTREKFEKVS